MTALDAANRKLTPVAGGLIISVATVYNTSGTPEFLS